MLDALKQLMGMGPKTDYKEVLSRGGIILDVRTPGEYAGGCVKGSTNIPLNELGNRLNKLSKDKPVITCCASGMRSSSAKTILERNGFKEVYNGGSWLNLRQYEK